MKATLKTLLLSTILSTAAVTMAGQRTEWEDDFTPQAKDTLHTPAFSSNLNSDGMYLQFGRNDVGNFFKDNCRGNASLRLGVFSVSPEAAFGDHNLSINLGADIFAEKLIGNHAYPAPILMAGAQAVIGGDQLYFAPMFGINPISGKRVAGVSSGVSIGDTETLRFDGAVGAMVEAPRVEAQQQPITIGASAALKKRFPQLLNSHGSITVQTRYDVREDFDYYSRGLLHSRLSAELVTPFATLGKASISTLFGLHAAKTTWTQSEWGRGFDRINTAGYSAGLLVKTGTTLNNTFNGKGKPAFWRDSHIGIVFSRDHSSFESQGAVNIVARKHFGRTQSRGMS